MAIISVSLPEKLEKMLDHLVTSGYFKSKSECIREALRNLSTRYQPDLFEENRHIITAITAIRDYHQKKVAKSISKVISTYEKILLSNFHMNMTNAYCLDMLIASGASKEIFRLIKSIREIKHYEGVDFVLLSSIPEHEDH